MKADVQHLLDTFDTSARHACELMGIAVTTFAYEPRSKDESRVRNRMLELAREKPRFGYRRLQVLLKREGMIVNHKRLCRMYKQAGLSVRRKRRKYLVRQRCSVAQATQVNQEWALDFVSDATARGRTIRFLAVVDAFSRKCFAREATPASLDGA